MKLALIIPIYKRHDLTKITLDRFMEQSKKFGFEIIVAGSEGEVSKKLASDCHYIEVPNEPLSNKHNALLTKAKELKVDGVVLFGSDVLVNDDYWMFINGFSKNESKLIGILDAWFYCTESKKIGHWKGYKNGQQSLGSGRFFSKKILDKLGWVLWNEGLMSGLDTNSLNNLKAKGVSEKIYTSDEAGIFMVDVKHTFSITNKAIVDLCEETNTNIMAKKIGKKDAKKVLDLEIPKKESLKSNLNGVVEIKGTGLVKTMPKNQFYTVDAALAEILINKGAAELC